MAAVITLFICVAMLGALVIFSDRVFMSNDKPITSSRHLLAFYQAYSDWLNAGAPQRRPFSRRAGLCCNLRVWCRERFPASDGYVLGREMKRQFEAAGLDDELPFNSEKHTYSSEVYLHCCHENPHRVQWVANRVADGIKQETAQ